jgi:hypothetical protein
VSPVERLEQQRRVAGALKAAWKLQSKMPLSKLLITAVNELGLKNGPKDLADVDDATLLAALERMIIKLKSIKQRK